MRFWGRFIIFLELVIASGTKCFNILDSWYGGVYATFLMIHSSLSPIVMGLGTWYYGKVCISLPCNTIYFVCIYTCIYVNQIEVEKIHAGPRIMHPLFELVFRLFLYLMFSKLKIENNWARCSIPLLNRLWKSEWRE